MNDHPPAQELEQYWRRTLPPADFLAVHRHVVKCPRCAEQGSSQQLERDFEELQAALVPETGEPYHLSAAELAAYCRGELTDIDLEIAQSHLVTCARCRDEAWVATAAPERGKMLPVVERGWQRPFHHLIDSRTWRVAAVIGAVAVLLLLAVFLFGTKTTNRPEQAGSPGASPDQRVVQSPTNNSGEPQSPPSEGVQLVLTLNDGGQQITLDNHGDLGGFESLPARVQQAVKSALQSRRIETSSAVAQLAGKPSTLLSQSDNGLAFRLISPVGKVVESERPVFSWSTLAGARSYTVSVTDVDLNEVATSPPLTSTEWRITKSLKPGAIYSWQVTALKDGKAITSPVLPAPQAKFKVVDGDVLQTLRQVKRSYPSSHLAAGVLYAEAGLFAKAEQELRALVRANPSDRTARDLLRHVQAMNQGRSSR
jgi:anti-sigma factor RsiW